MWSLREKRLFRSSESRPETIGEMSSEAFLSGLELYSDGSKRLGKVEMDCSLVAAINYYLWIDLLLSGSIYLPNCVI